MTASTVGQCAPFLGASSTEKSGLRTSTFIGAWFGSRNGLALLGAGGQNNMAGYTRLNGSPVVRRVVIMTQPPCSQIISEFQTTVQGSGAFQFRCLAPGNYLVLDCVLDNSRQALVYDWIVQP
jgi:hypothetical protein